MAETHQFTHAFVIAAAVVLVGVVGWVCMLPRVAPIVCDALDKDAVAKSRA